MNTYKRIIVTGSGGTAVLQAVEESLPQPGPGQVCVKVLAAGVGFSDVMAQHGGYPLAPRIPFTPGYDLVGTVDRIGTGIRGLIPGQMVAALDPRMGCYAEYVLVPAQLLVPVPPNLDPAEVVSLILNYLTAHCILHKKAAMRSGETALIHGAAGGVGTALLQLGRLLGLKMYGTASEGKLAVVAAMDATPIDYRKQNFLEVLRQAHPAGIDAAFDPVGGANLRRSYQAVRNGGRVVSYGFAGEQFGGLLTMIGGVLQMGFLNILPDGKRVRLCATPGEVKNDNAWYRATLAELLALMSAGQIRPVVGARLPLCEVRKAHELLEQSKISGKVVLTMSAPA